MLKWPKMLFLESPYSEKLIQSTIDFWQPRYKKTLTRDDAEEILRNLSGFLNTLWEMDQNQRHRLIEGYYQARGIQVIGFLAQDLLENNFKALQYIEYAIEHFTGTPGIEELLSDVVQVNKAGSEGEQIYHNSIMQFHALYFVHKVLKLKILEVESKSHKVLSPRRQGDKSCDILALDSRKQVFFESKDSSSEILTQYETDGAVHFTPALEDDICKWIVKRCRDAEGKGAD